MTGLWDDLKKQIKEMGNVALGKAGEFTKVATDKAEELTRLGKVKLDVLQLKRDRERLFTEFGENLYKIFQKKKTAKVSDSEELSELFEKIRQKEEELLKKQAEVDRIKEMQSDQEAESDQDSKTVTETDEKGASSEEESAKSPDKQSAQKEKQKKKSSETETE